MTSSRDLARAGGEAKYCIFASLVALRVIEEWNVELWHREELGDPHAWEHQIKG